MQAILVDNLSYSLKPHFFSRTRQVLDRLSFEVGQGEIMGFLGPNGAGKTTTLKILLGLLQPSLGAVYLNGQSPTLASARRRIGFLPERAYYPQHVSASEFVVTHAILSGYSPTQAQQKSREALTQVGLEHAATQSLGTFSKGMLQRAGLAQALVGDPDIIILDEPMSGLDPLGRRDVRTLMQSLRAAGKTVFFSTHVLPDVELICDKVVLLMHGKIKQQGSVHELLAEQGNIEIHTENLPTDAFENLQPLIRAHRVHADGHCFEVATRSEANILIDRIREHGGVISGMQTVHGLETLFSREAAR